MINFIFGALFMLFAVVIVWLLLIIRLQKEKIELEKELYENHSYSLFDRVVKQAIDKDIQTTSDPNHKDHETRKDIW